MHQFTINSPLPCSSYRECTHITETKQASLNTTPFKCMLLLLHQAATFTNVTLSDLITLIILRWGKLCALIQLTQNAMQMLWHVRCPVCHYFNDRRTRCTHKYWLQLSPYSAVNWREKLRCWRKPGTARC